MGKIVAANWKMNLRRDAARALASSLAGQGRDLWLFPGFTLLETVRQATSGSSVKLGAQDLSPEVDGAFTGDISAEMLVDAGATMVLVGHSERRHSHGETAALLLRKLHRALAAGLAPLLCVGETMAQRQAGRAEKVVRDQLGLVKKLTPAAREKFCAVAYEPVWAIGTGQNATAAQVGAMHNLARAEMNGLGMGTVPLLYGGSVKPENAGELLAVAGVDGLLVGGASLELESLQTIDDLAG